MKSRLGHTFPFLFLASLAACQKGDFRGVDQAAGISDDGSAAGEGLYLPGLKNMSVPGEQLLPAGKDVDVLIQPGRRILQDGNVEPAPLAIYFLLDITASMEVNIAGVKQNVTQMVHNLKQANFAPQIGLLGFRDQVMDQFTQALTPDVNLFSAAVGRLQADGGDDSNEGALLAVQTGLARINQEERRPGAVKVLIPVTDNPAHYGMPQGCQLDGILQSFAALPVAEKPNVKLFYSANAGPQYPIRLDPTSGARTPFAAPQFACAGFSTARQQFDALLGRMLPEIVNPGERGGAIEYPISATSLVSELVPKLKAATGSVDRVCLARNAMASVEGRMIHQWQAPSLQDMVRAAQAGNPVPLKGVFKAADAAMYNGREARVQIMRCCLNQADLGANDFPAVCASEEVQTITLKLRSGP